MTRNEQLLIYLIGETNRLAGENRITHGRIHLDIPAIEIYKELLENNFEATITIEERSGLIQWLEQNDPRQLITEP